MLFLFHSSESRSYLCEALLSLLGTAGVPAGSMQEQHIGIPNLNLIILFQQVCGDWPLPSFFQKELLFVSHAAGQALPEPSPG